MSTTVFPPSRASNSCVFALQVHRIDLDTPEGFGVSFATYGATLLSVRSGDKDGNIEEVTEDFSPASFRTAGMACGMEPVVFWAGWGGSVRLGPWVSPFKISLELRKFRVFLMLFLGTRTPVYDSPRMEACPCRRVR